MEKDLLICDDSASLGRLLVRRFINLGIRSECCRSSLNQIQKLTSASVYHGILLFAFQPDERLFSFIKKAKQNGTAVFACLYTSSASVHESFRKAGVIRCFTMPCSVSELCRSVMLRLNASEELLTQIEIVLEEAGFPPKLSGFYYLAKACELCMNSPERLWGGLIGIYNEIAENYSTKPSLVERSMRNLGAHICQTDTLSQITDGRLTEKPTNTEMICAVCDMFTRL
ncbi:MAG: sporulation initiation factor Spo0A C-terminal domain-containing protein [Ruminococcus sp.]|uniref:sporulation initiation factor Spo0A C-terminal domain-containing protein n=1 Tax=Ruminococcus sp. TaxID=41978 RepID=UPI0025CDBA2B|nr:sporulation initiation factor Spo0A C-terminal domain-containing protein [Ruminococcus sp.]MCR5601749.1 sporulation initiation factor Spo0A C-terminal domain-containing protein [Ruminococcus sp.]